MASRYWNKALKTRVFGFSYDYTRRTGIFYLPRAACAHMPAAIEFFEQIDPRVQVICCFTGDGHTQASCQRFAPDTIYRKQLDAKWTATLIEENGNPFSA